MKTLSRLFVLMFFLVPISASAQTSSCQEFTSANGEKAVFCPDRDGRWTQTDQSTFAKDGVALSDTPDIIPDTFRGEFTYEGNYSGVIKTKANRVRQLSLGGLLESALSSKEYPLAGSYKIVLEFDGNSVKGRSYPVSSTGRNGVSLDPSSFNGTRNGSYCTLYWNDGYTTKGECSPTRFSFESSGKNQQGHQVDFTVSALTSDVVDYVERDRLRAIAEAERVRLRAELERVRAENDRLLADPSAPIARRLDAIAEIDSRAWMSNTYVPGSMTGVVKNNVTSKNNYALMGQFKYGNGSFGKMMAIIENGKVSRVMFGDESAPRPLGAPESRSITAGIFGSLLRGMATSGSSGSMSDRERRDMNAMKALQGQ